MENEAKLALKSDQKSISTSKGRFYKSTYKTNRILMIFDVRGGRSWEQKAITNLPKHEINMGTRLGIDFLWILMDFGRQLGPENPIRSGQIRSDQIRSGQVRSDQIRSDSISLPYLTAASRARRP